MRLCDSGVSAYNVMLNILTGVSFEGMSDVALKVAVTIFHIGSKYLSCHRPRLSFLLSWAAGRITRDEVILCEAKILEGLGFELETYEELSEEELVVLCMEMEREIWFYEN